MSEYQTQLPWKQIQGTEAVLRRFVFAILKFFIRSDGIQQFQKHF